MDRVLRCVDRVEADVECLMCGRLIGQLFGVRLRDASAGRSARSVANLTTFCEPTPDAQPMQVPPLQRFQCQQCGGMGVVGEVSLRVVAEEIRDQGCPVHTTRRMGRGRPPKGCLCYRECSAA